MMANQGDGSSSLPSHLERAEYLESTGTQYIDLGYPLGYNNKVAVDVYSTKQTANNIVFGNETTSSKGYVLRIDTGSSLCRFGNSVTSSTAKYRDKRQLCTIDYFGVYMNDEFYKWSSPPSDFITDGNVFLFACRNASGAATYNYKGKFYSCQIYENDVLIHDYIPCFNTENRRPCMYDTITGIELYNQGTGEFNYHIEGRPIPYLAFEALEDDLQVSITKSATQYSLDRVTWVDLPAEELTQPISKGEKVWFRANITSQDSIVGTGNFRCTKKCNLDGTPMSLMYGDECGDKTALAVAYCFKRLFYGNTNIVRVNNPKSFLPAIALSNYCYQETFAYSSVENAVYLPSLQPTMSCYRGMYQGDANLVEAYDFPEWTGVSQYICAYMYSATSLVRQPKITSSVDITHTDVFAYMFYKCGKLKEAQDRLLPLVISASTYNSMYRESGIVKAPQIDAVTNKGTSSSMVYMFQDCYYLKEAPSDIYIDKLYGSYMFANCPNLKKGPRIRSQYNSSTYMYSNCSNLDYIFIMTLDAPTTTNNTITKWVQDVSPKGTIVLNKNIEWNPEDYRGANGIPEGWDVKYCDPDNLDDIRDEKW